MPNELKNEKSPYLKQHENNPVDWLPWKKNTLDKAKKERKPIFLSVGYASCHWCHVMAHESFENNDTAKIMNEKFINIKVDREERPDLDFVFQKSLALLTGTPGGGPLSMFLDENGNYDKRKAQFSLLSAGVPGTVAGLHLALTKYGTMTWQEVLEPSIRLAEQGFSVPHDLANILASERYKKRLSSNAVSYTHLTLPTNREV